MLPKREIKIADVANFYFFILKGYQERVASAYLKIIRAHTPLIEYIIICKYCY